MTTCPGGKVPAGFSLEGKSYSALRNRGPQSGNFSLDAKAAKAARFWPVLARYRLRVRVRLDLGVELGLRPFLRPTMNRRCFLL